PDKKDFRWRSAATPPARPTRIRADDGHPEVGIGLSLTSEHDITRFWVQHWVQLIEGRMAFPVRKRRQIGHLAYLLHWLRARRPGVQVSPGAPLLANKRKAIWRFE